MEPSDKKLFLDLLPDLVNQIDPTEILPYLTFLRDMGRQTGPQSPLPPKQFFWPSTPILKENLACHNDLMKHWKVCCPCHILQSGQKRWKALCYLLQQQIINRQRQDSTHAAMMLLYEHLGRWKKGFQEFVMGLKELGFEELANRLSPDKVVDEGNIMTPGLQVDDTQKKSINQSEKDKQHNTSKKVVHESKPVEKDNTSKQIAHSSAPTKPKRTRMTKQMAKVGHSTLVKDLNAGVQSILVHLDYSGEKKWQDLAGHLGCSFRDCQKIENDASIKKASPTLELMNHCTDVTLGEILQILRDEMDRIDVAEKLEQFTGFKLPEVEDDREGLNPNMDGSTENQEGGGQTKSINGKCPSINGELSVKHDMNASSANARVIYERRPVPGHTETSGDLNRNKKVVIAEENKHEHLKPNSAALHNQALSYNPEDLPKPVMRPQTKTVNEGYSSVSSDNLFESGNSMSAPMQSQVVSCHNHAISNIHTDDKNKDCLDTSTGIACGTAMELYKTGTYGTLMELPHSSGEPRMVRRVQFHQQDSAPPGPYEPVTAGTPVIAIPSGPLGQGINITPEAITQQQDSPGLIAHPTDTSVHMSATGHVSDGSDPMLISVGEPLSIHHRDNAQDSVDDFSSSCAEIQSKAIRSLWKPTNIAVSQEVDSLDNPEEESDAPEHNQASGDLESYELTKSLFNSVSSMESSSHVQLISQPGSDLYNRRKSNGTIEPMSTVAEGTNSAEDTNSAEGVNIYTEVQESVDSTRQSRTVGGDEVSDNQQTVARNNVTVRADTQEGDKAYGEVQEDLERPRVMPVVRSEFPDAPGCHYSGIQKISHGTTTSEEGSAGDAQYSAIVRGEISLDHPSSNGGDSVNAGADENRSNGNANFPWKSMVALGTAAVAVTAVFRSLKS